MQINSHVKRFNGQKDLVLSTHTDVELGELRTPRGRGLPGAHLGEGDRYPIKARGHPISASEEALRAECAFKRDTPTPRCQAAVEKHTA
jgi:hypothetical protein